MQSNTSTPKGAAHPGTSASHPHQASGRGRRAVLAFALAACLSACLALGWVGTASAQSPGTDQYTEPVPDGGGEPTNTNAPGSPDTGGETDAGSGGAAASGDSTTSTTSDATTSTGSTAGSGGANGSGDDGKDTKDGDGEGSSAKGSPRDAGAVLSAAPKLATSDGSGDELWRSIWLPLLLVLSLIVAVGIRLRTSRSSSEDS